MLPRSGIPATRTGDRYHSDSHSNTSKNPDSERADTPAGSSWGVGRRLARPRRVPRGGSAAASKKPLEKRAPVGPHDRAVRQKWVSPAIARICVSLPRGVGKPWDQMPGKARQAVPRRASDSKPNCPIMRPACCSRIRSASTSARLDLFRHPPEVAEPMNCRPFRAPAAP